MDLSAAKQLVETSFGRMNALYGTVVFDEWIILTLGSRMVGALSYVGPREETYRSQLAADVQPLIAEAIDDAKTVGDFDFTTKGTGTKHDAIIKIAASAYLVCNNTEKSFAEIRADARWLKAQTVFFDLCEKFRGDPLAL